MNFSYFLEQIQLAPEGCENFWTIHRQIDEPAFAQGFEHCKAAFLVSDSEFAEAIGTFARSQDLAPEVWNMYLCIRLAEDTLADFRSRGIGDDIFYATLFDLTVCCRVCQAASGIYGIGQNQYRRWMHMVLTGKLYRLGRLEFELAKSPMDIQLDRWQLAKGAPCLHVHIPRYQPLDEEACEASYDQARSFFARYFGISRCCFLCHSWLLHPWLKEVLPEGSRILGFQNRFRLLEVTQDIPAAVSWIFPNCKDKDICEYPAETALQRAALAQIQSGGSMGLGLGIRL